jgi:hypothetical protein
MGNPVISVYKKLPEERKKLINDYLAVLKKMARSGTEVRFKVYEDLEEKKFVYLTTDEPDTVFIESFFPGATVTRVNTIYLWSLRKFAREHDRVIIDMHPRLAHFFTDGIITVRWVRQAFDLSTPVEELFKHRERRRERKKALTFEPVFSKKPEDMDFFYDRMYLPFIQKRHSDAIIMKKVFLQKDLETTGELCLLKKDGQIVAGGFGNHVGNSYYMLVLGMIDEKYVEEGAVAAIFYYGIHRALEKKAAYFDFGLTRPFIDDGVCIYKRKWGGQIQRDPETSHVVYLKNIRKDGLVILDHDKLKVLVSAENTACMQLCSDIGLEAKII